MPMQCLNLWLIENAYRNDIAVTVVNVVKFYLSTNKDILLLSAMCPTGEKKIFSEFVSITAYIVTMDKRYCLEVHRFDLQARNSTRSHMRLSPSIAYV